MLGVTVVRVVWRFLGKKLLRGKVADGGAKKVEKLQITVRVGCGSAGLWAL